MNNGALHLLKSRKFVVVACTCALAVLTYGLSMLPAASPDTSTAKTMVALESGAAPQPPPARDGTLDMPPMAASLADPVSLADGTRDDAVPDVAALARGLEARLAHLLDELEAAPDAQRARAELAQLKSEMLAGPPEAAAIALGSFLASGRDAVTGLPFVVGAEGAMASVPTLRAFALDVLPSVELALSVSISRAVLDEAVSDVESSLALRNLAWNDLDGDMEAELVARFTRFLGNETWARQPSQAYLEAFDVAVDLAAPSLFARLSALAAHTDRDAAANALGHAAFVALDRQVVKDHGILLDALARDPQLLAVAPLVRASLMSRLDMTVDVERAALLGYLGDAGRLNSELDYFGELYPNGNYFYGNWLVTASEVTPSITEQRTRDSATLTEIDRVLAAAPAVRVRETLTRVRERLLHFETGAAPSDGGASNQRAPASETLALPTTDPGQ